MIITFVILQELGRVHPCDLFSLSSEIGEDCIYQLDLPIDHDVVWWKVKRLSSPLHTTHIHHHQLVWTVYRSVRKVKPRISYT